MFSAVRFYFTLLLYYLKCPIEGISGTLKSFRITYIVVFDAYTVFLRLCIKYIV